MRYDGDLAEADYEYGYGEALKDRAVVRPVYFPRIKGHMEWTAPGGLEYAATFDDPLTRELANQRLRTALDTEGDWLASVIEQAHAQLCHLRTRDPRAAGLVIAMDQEHARSIAGIMQERLGRHRGRRHLGRAERVGEDQRVRATGRRPGSSPCAWSPRGSTSRACASASTRPTR